MMFHNTSASVLYMAYLIRAISSKLWDPEEFQQVNSLSGSLKVIGNRIID